jgi:hypothetical protein
VTYFSGDDDDDDDNNNNNNNNLKMYKVLDFCWGSGFDPVRF